MSNLARVLLAILLPPLGVFLTVGIGGQFWLNILLTLLGYVPGTSMQSGSLRVGRAKAQVAGVRRPSSERFRALAMRAGNSVSVDGSVWTKPRR
jgi:uncharacterized membrane protein YqaE (UPF0057 family)